MSTKHTPGPWTMHPRFDDGAEVCAIAPVAWCGVATTVGSSGDQSIDAAEARANARLIAAAPDLLAVLRIAQAVFADIGDREPGDDLAWCEARAAEALPLVRAAIAKAKGEKP
jgi:hypothetical protein